MKTLIVDDIKLSRQGLSNLLETYFPECEVVGSVPSVLMAKKVLSEQKIQLIFLDIQLSDGLGFEILDSLDSDTKVVLLTAHEHYAIEAVRKGAFDYLLKPLNVEELQNCMKRLKEEISLELQEDDFEDNDYTLPIEKRLGIVSFDGVDYVDTDTILFLRAHGKYTEVFTTEGVFLSSKNLKQFDQILTNGFFMRIHHSFIVNLYTITKYKKEDNMIVLSNRMELPVAKARKELLFKRITTV